ncbi:hypothetical protein L596_003773 [Steinernema carpocapsae]|uniref:Ig-like domain-containing protein n=1 Tax=Steinernema carpocapsae TaxID=34508 RepID=A0A4U8UWZ7_STECR|nr:hypothetical protein L596_003773 [Steinernema carpocapsae]
MTKFVSSNIVLFVLLSALCVFWTSAEKELLRLEQEPLEGNKYVVRARKTFRVACIYQRHDMIDPHDQLVWTNVNGDVIDGQSDVSTFTLTFKERGTKYWKEVLVFRDIQPRDSQTYSCKSNVNGEQVERKIEIVVIDKMQWAEKEDVVGAMEGEPLIVDCGASGEPKPEVKITNDVGEPLDEHMFNVANDKVTIDKLSMEYQGAKVKCLAVQTFDKFDTTSIEEHEKMIDVWYPPKFESHEIEAFGIIGRPAILFCNVSRSNPPATHFHFFKDGEELKDNSKYQLKLNVLKQIAELKIFDVEADDFSAYKCEVNNGKAKTFVEIALKEANPPDEVRVELRAANTDGVVWRIQSDQKDELPVLFYRIQHMRKELYLNYQDEEEESESFIWQKHGNTATVPTNSEHLYETSGLRENTDYVFRFAGINAAGSGNTIKINVRTVPTEASSQEMNSAPFASVSVLLALLATFLYLN